MYSLVFTYCDIRFGVDNDFDFDLKYQYSLSNDITYIYENLDYDMLFDLLQKEISELKRVKNGEILISLMGD